MGSDGVNSHGLFTHPITLRPVPVALRPLPCARCPMPCALSPMSPPIPITPRSLESLGLARREAEVLFWTGKGHTAQEVAQILTISELTVKKHLQNGYQKLGVKNRTLAITTSLERLGLLNANDWTSP